MAANDFYLARSQAPDEMKETQPFEEYLRAKLRKSADVHRRAQYWAVPLYLQHLLHDASTRYTSNADNYSNLVNQLLPLRPLFVSFNYDTLLDDRLAAYPAPALGMDEYMASDRNWTLLKPHGSINWGRKLVDAAGEPMRHPPRDYLHPDHISRICHQLATEQLFPAAEIVFSSDSRDVNTRDLRRDPNGFFLYPALSAPLGAEDDVFTCPESHLTAAAEIVGDADVVDILIVGYSCLDSAVLRHLGARIRGTSSIEIVLPYPADLENAQGHLREHFGSGFDYLPREQKFTEFVRGGLSESAQRLSAAGN
jgi:hypothetical protein